MNEGQQGWLTLIIYFIIYLICILLPCWIIAKKAGYKPWLSLLILIPFFNLIVFCYFAFMTWPIQKELINLKKNT